MLKWKKKPKKCQQMKRDLIYLIALILSLPPCLHARSPTGGEDENPCWAWIVWMDQVGFRHMFARLDPPSWTGHGQPECGHNLQVHKKTPSTTLICLTQITVALSFFVARPHIPISKLTVSESYETYISRSFQVTREILAESKSQGKEEL